MSLLDFLFPKKEESDDDESDEKPTGIGGGGFIKHTLPDSDIEGMMYDD